MSKYLSLKEFMSTRGIISRGNWGPSGVGLKWVSARGVDVSKFFTKNHRKIILFLNFNWKFWILRKVYRILSENRSGTIRQLRHALTERTAVGDTRSWRVYEKWKWKINGNNQFFENLQKLCEIFWISQGNLNNSYGYP